MHFSLPRINNCCAATAPIRPATAQNAALQPATTAARKATSAANAAPLRRRNHVIAAVKSATSRASAPIPLEELRPEAWAAGIPVVVEEAVRSATSAEKWAISLATAMRAVQEATEEVAMVEVAMAVGMELVAHSRLVTPAADTDTCHETAPRDKSVTTAEKSAI
ncbi:MAG: hypothetical protein Q9209_004270 [Squamulea sp. 1 TL-2023]